MSVESPEPWNVKNAANENGANPPGTRSGGVRPCKHDEQRTTGKKNNNNT